MNKYVLDTGEIIELTDKEADFMEAFFASGSISISSIAAKDLGVYNPSNVVTQLRAKGVIINSYRSFDIDRFGRNHRSVAFYTVTNYSKPSWLQLAKSKIQNHTSGLSL